jgi:hypothetical protein
MAPGRDYRVAWNGQPLVVAEQDDGVVQVVLPVAGAGLLEIAAKER